MKENKKQLDFIDASSQLKTEIEVVINRYAIESDILFSQVIGVLEMIKVEEIQRWKKI